MDKFFSTPNSSQLNEKHRQAVKQIQAANVVGPIMLNEACDFVAWPTHETPRSVEVNIAEVVTIDEIHPEIQLVTSDGEAA